MAKEIREIRGIKRDTKLDQAKVKFAIKMAIAKRTLRVTSSKEGGWVVKKDASTATGVKKFSNKIAAVTYGRRASKKENSVLIIYDKAGQIEESSRNGKRRRK